MLQIMCLEHHLAPVADARTRTNVRTGSWLTVSSIFATKPYATQRPSGAPPG